MENSQRYRQDKPLRVSLIPKHRQASCEILPGLFPPLHPLFNSHSPWSPFQNKNLDWFPRMRAMSLVSNEGEGEQNEIRNLQDKLNTTMKLVSHLTSQLNELKEQVLNTF